MRIQPAGANSSAQLQQLVRQLAPSAGSDDEPPQSFQDVLFVMGGYGSIGRPLSLRLQDLGARRFVLIDPKRYHAHSVGSQCTADEANRLKVEIGAEQLRKCDAEVTAIADDLYSVPEGIVASGAVLIASVDNRRADIGANRLAARMRARLVKLNVEPAFARASVRCYDFRRENRLCAECQFNDKQYEEQRHPKSCDGAGRRTASPPQLSDAAAELGLTAIGHMVREGDAAAAWYGHEHQISLKTGKVRRSQLCRKPSCRWDHDETWTDLEHLSTGPGDLTLASLARQAGVATGSSMASVRFCHRVGLRARCGSCGVEARHVHWLADVDAEVGQCPRCGGVLQAVSFWTSWQFQLDELQSVFNRPIADWGVPPLAVLEFHSGSRRKALVVGKE